MSTFLALYYHRKPSGIYGLPSSLQCSPFTTDAIVLNATPNVIESSFLFSPALALFLISRTFSQFNFAFGFLSPGFGVQFILFC